MTIFNYDHCEQFNHISQFDLNISGIIKTIMVIIFSRGSKVHLAMQLVLDIALANFI